MRPGLRALLACLTAGALSGCGLFVSDSPPPAQPCAWMSDGAIPPSTGRSVLLIDRSGSTWRSDEPNALVPDYTTALKASAQAAVERGDAVSIGTFDGTAATVRWFADSLRTDRGDPNPDNKADARTEATGCLLTRLSQAGTASPRVGGSDPYGALTVARQNLARGTAGRHIEIATDGLATTGCADLTHAGIGSDRVIEQIVARCRTTYHGLDLAGVTVRMLGIGHPATGQPQPQPQPSTLQLSWLGGLWSALCGLSRADCDISTDAVSAPSAGTGRTGQAPADPVVTFPPWDIGVRTPDGGLDFNFDGSLLFSNNDWHISPTGAQRLRQVAARIRQLGPATVTVDGYTQAERSPAINKWLAQHRADAVASVLRGYGVGPVVARGHPDTAPHCPPQYDSRHRPYEPGQQCTRRVNIHAAPLNR